MINLQTLKEFQKELSSKKSTPAGGVVSALTANFAASLVEMVCNLTLDNEKYLKVKKDILKIHKDIKEIKEKLTKLTDEDKKAYEKVLLSYKKGKKDEIKKSLKYAIEVPMEVRKLSQIIEKLAYRVSKIGNKKTISEAKTAIHLAHAASKSALENIKINKQSLLKL